MTNQQQVDKILVWLKEMELEKGAGQVIIKVQDGNIVFKERKKVFLEREVIKKGKIYVK